MLLRGQKLATEAVGANEACQIASKSFVTLFHGILGAHKRQSCHLDGLNAVNLRAEDIVNRSSADLYDDVYVGDIDFI